MKEVGRESKKAWGAFVQFSFSFPRKEVLPPYSLEESLSERALGFWSVQGMYIKALGMVDMDSMSFHNMESLVEISPWEV